MLTFIKKILEKFLQFVPFLLYFFGIFIIFFWNFLRIFQWFDARRMTNVCERWAIDKTNDLQAAYFNGVGYESWENVWGIWNQITPR